MNNISTKSAKAEAQYANAPKKERHLYMGKALVKDLFSESLVEKMSDKRMRMIGECYCDYLKAGGDDQLLHSALAASKVMWEKMAAVNCLRSYRHHSIPKDIEAKCKEYIHWVKECRNIYLSMEREYGRDVSLRYECILQILEFEVEDIIRMYGAIPA